MKKILSYGNRKSETIYWDISNEDLFKKAIVELFTLLDEAWNVYIDLEENEQEVCVECAGSGNIKLKAGVYTCPKCDGYSPNSSTIESKNKQRKLYKLAKGGDIKAAYMLLEQRKGCEYEEWFIHNVRE